MATSHEPAATAREGDGVSEPFIESDPTDPGLGHDLLEAESDGVRPGRRRAGASTWLRLLLLTLGPIVALAGAAGLLLTMAGPVDIVATCAEAADVTDLDAQGTKIERTLVPAQQTCLMPDGRRVDLLPPSATTIPASIIGGGLAITAAGVLLGLLGRRDEEADGDLDDIEGLDEDDDHLPEDQDRVVEDDLAEADGRTGGDAAARIP